MPPLPKSKTSSSAERPGRSFEEIQKDMASGERPRARTTRSSSAASPKGPARGRVTKEEGLEQKIALMYTMMGAALRPFGRFYPALTNIGDQMSSLSDEAATAWMELARQDKRVMEAWISITGASVYGNIVGIHLAIFASAIPGAGGHYVQQVMGAEPGMMSQDDMIAQARAAGLSEEDIAQAMRMAQAAAQQGTGGPGDTIRTGGQPIPDPPPINGSGRSGIVSPEELGATQAGPDGSFPSDTSPPNAR